MKGCCAVVNRLICIHAHKLAHDVAAASIEHLADKTGNTDEIANDTVTYLGTANRFLHLRDGWDGGTFSSTYSCLA